MTGQQHLLELILATSKHTAKGRDALNGVDPLASTWVLPPTLTVQYHFLPEAKIRPYVGAGINYTRISSVRVRSNIAGADMYLTARAWGRPSRSAPITS